MRFKKLIAIFIAILMMFSTSIPAIAATNTVETVGGYHRFKVNGHDAYCIDATQLSSVNSLTNDPIITPTPVKTGTNIALFGSIIIVLAAGVLLVILLKKRKSNGSNIA